MTTAASAKTPEERQLRANLSLAREELADTVAALAHKANVPSRIEQRATQKVRSVLVKLEPLSKRADALMLVGQSMAPRFSQLMAFAGQQRPQNPVGAVLTGVFILRLLRARKRR